MDILIVILLRMGKLCKLSSFQVESRKYLLCNFYLQSNLKNIKLSRQAFYLIELR